MSDEAEQAISAEADARYPRLTADGMRESHAFVAGAMWGRASRDAEVAAYQSQLGKSFDEYESLREQLAEREAVIERVRAYAEDRAFHARGHLNTVNSGRIASDLQAILAASPSTVLAEHDEKGGE